MTDGSTIRVLIADDQELVRTGLRMILDAQDDIEVVGEAVDGSEAVDLAQSLRPDVCLFDIRMPRLDGIEATRILAGPGVEDPMAVVVITTFDLDEYVYAALRAGARGFLLKDAGSALLGQAIRAAADGEALIAPNVTVRLLEAFAEQPHPEPAAQPTEPLTAREEDVAATVARGLSNSEIAAELHITLSTVKTHLASLMTKLGVRNRVEIAIWALGRRDRPMKEHDMSTTAEDRETAVPAAALVRPHRVGRASRDLQGHRRPARDLAPEARQVGHDARHDDRPQVRAGAQRHPGLLRGRPEPRHHGDERLGRGRAGLVAEPAGESGCDGDPQERQARGPRVGRDRHGARAPLGALAASSATTRRYSKLRSTETAVVVLSPR